MNVGYFSDLSLVDWIGIVLFAPLLLALGILMIYLVIGMIGSGPRRRRIAKRSPDGATGASKPTRATRQTPGD